MQKLHLKQNIQYFQPSVSIKEHMQVIYIFLEASFKRASPKFWVFLEKQRQTHTSE